MRIRRPAAIAASLLLAGEATSVPASAGPLTRAAAAPLAPADYQYVVAEAAGAQPLIANRTLIGPEGRFDLNVG